MGLRQYWKKRNFKNTPEPKGKAAPTHGRLRCVIQKHAASRLHYDFRLELNGTLKSWAVPKGPSLDPSQKRLAVHVEDHPLDYATFEGIIPAGQYGGGTVLLWDQGYWEPIGDPGSSYRRGRLKFVLQGENCKVCGALFGWEDARKRARKIGCWPGMNYRWISSPTIIRSLTCRADSAPCATIHGKITFP